MNELTPADAALSFAIENPNGEVVQAQLTITPTPPAEAMIMIGDEAPIPFSELEPIRLTATDSAQIRVTALKNSTPYTIVIVTVDTIGNAHSDISIETATPLPSATDTPTNLTARPGNTEVTLTWRGVTGALEYRIYQAVGDDPALPIVTIAAPTPTPTTPDAIITYIDTALTNGTSYSYMVRAVKDGLESGNSNVVSSVTPIPSPDAPTNFNAVVGNAQVSLNWEVIDEATEYRIYRSVGNTLATLLPTTPEALTTTIYTDSSVNNGTEYTYTVRAVNNGGESGSSNPVFATPIEIDSNNNMLIDISSLEELNNVRYNLAGTSYRTSASDTGVRCGGAGDMDCTGYELMRDLDFADAASYDSDDIETDWRPDNTDPDMANNPGWLNIGTLTAAFTTIFEGNNNTISNLYLRRNNEIGLFGAIDTGAVISNLNITGDLYSTGGNFRETWSAGALVGRQQGGTITNSRATAGIIRMVGIGGTVGGLVGWQDGGSIIDSYATINVFDDHTNSFSDRIGGLVGLQDGGSIVGSYANNNELRSGGGADQIGGLVGRKRGGNIFNSYATGTIMGGSGNSKLGGLVGQSDNNSTVEHGGNIVASYATGNVDGGTGREAIGGLVGECNNGNIVASYATGNVDGGAGSDNVGVLVGVLSDSGGGSVIIASYATGNADGGADSDSVGGLIGEADIIGNITIIASYYANATGNVDGGAGNDDVGGLIGEVLSGSGSLTITASYASAGMLDGGLGTNDSVGRFTGNAFATTSLMSVNINDNYGFGTPINQASDGFDSDLGETVPVATAAQLTSTNAGASWNEASSGTMGAWDFRTTNDLPILQYADYDGGGNAYACANEANPPADAILIPNCTTPHTPLPGQ